ncbi:MAG: DEAD/DEAH box helicase [Clostridia bacterium]|nr:DEAD/DEAH box helicase [Clostridia bacterium]
MLALKDIKGVGPSTIKKLQELGIETIPELFSLLPTRYIDLRSPVKISDAGLNENCLISGRVEKISAVSHFGNKAFSVNFSDNLSENRLKFKANFYNMPFLHDSFKVGDSYRILTKFTDEGAYVISNPQLEKEDKSGKLDGIYTVYPLRGILGQNVFKNIITTSLDMMSHQTFEGYQGQVEYDLYHIFDRIHRPVSVADAKKALADLASVDMGIALEIYRKSAQNGRKTRKVFYKIDNSVINEYENALDFTLTESQVKAIKDSEEDLKSTKNMSRIICGDVGSGKTAVAFYLMYLASLSGHQAVMMAPTEILASQHAKNFEKIALKLNISYSLLTSSTPKTKRDAILNGLYAGNISCVFGTHSLFSEDVRYKDLSLAIIDEQHRFGVHDREKLEEKGASDIVSMTATPIPRSLALSFYENLAVSTIVKREEALTNVHTSVVSNLDLALNTVLALAMNGKQAFIVCPAIEDSEGNLIFSTEKFKDRYSDRFSGVRVAYINGRMSQKEKDEVMNDFASGITDVLVATSIIEVGIDTKATEMLIVNADRFGLASIHQLRGRIGRDGSSAHCILHTNSLSETSAKRLETLVNSNDGQHISEVDFEMRGPGDFIGTKQSGISLTPVFGLAFNAKTLSNSRIYADSRLKNLSLHELLSIVGRSRQDVSDFLDEIGKVTLNS